MKKCPNGHPLPEGAKFCPICGATVNFTETKKSFRQDNSDYAQQQDTRNYAYQQSGQQYYQQPEQQYQAYGTAAATPLTDFRGEIRSPGSVILLSIITCGIYAIYWLYTVAKEINSILGRDATNPSYSIVGILCFIFSFILIYQIDKAILEIDHRQGVHSSSKFLMWMLLTIFLGIGLFIMQYEVQSRLNSLYQGDR